MFCSVLHDWILLSVCLLYLICWIKFILLLICQAACNVSWIFVYICVAL